MHYEIYIDSMLLMHFVLNLYLLILVNRSIGDTVGPFRILAGALVGAGGAVIPLLINGSVPLKIVLEVLIGSFGMLLVTFPVRNWKGLLELFERMIWISFCVGGVMVFLMRFMSGVSRALSGGCVVLCIGGIAFLFVGKNIRLRGRKACLCRATLVFRKNRVCVTALLDSGNSLTEPISGKPVSVVDEQVLCSLGLKDKHGYRAIPYHSIGKTRGILEGYILPELILEYHGVNKKLCNIYVASCPEAISGSGDDEGGAHIRMIINPQLIYEKKKKERPKKRTGRFQYDTEGCNTRKNEV